MTTTEHQVFKRKSGWQLIDFKELYHYRDLFFLLVARDIKVRYRQTVLGGIWSIINPFSTMVVFTLFFGKLANMPSEGIPYPIFSFSAIIAWNYFAGAVSASSNSIISYAGLISKVYYPRLLSPLAPIVSGLLDFAIAFTILIGMMLYYHIYTTAMVLFIPLLVALMMLTAFGVGSIIAPLNAKYRDIGYVVPFLLQLWMFASPIIYPTSMLPARFRMIYALNPLTGIIEGFRSILLGTVAFPTQMILISVVESVVLFIIGAYYFRQTEHFFADVL